MRRINWPRRVGAIARDRSMVSRRCELYVDVSVSWLVSLAD